MAFPLFQLGAMALSSVLGNMYYNRASMQSPDLVPRMTPGGWDTRTVGLGAGALGLFFGPIFPFLGALGLGLGVAAINNYNTMGHVKAMADTFVAAQQLPGPGLNIPGLPGGMPLPSGLESFFAPAGAEASRF